MLAVALAIEFAPLPGGSRLWRAAHDAGHVPALGIAALAFLRMLQSLWSGARARPVAAYAIAFALAAALGGVLELLQIGTTRDASWSDVARDAAGAAGFLALHATSWRSLFKARTDPPLVKARRVLRGAALVLLLAAMSPLFFWSAAFAVRDVRFPVIYRPGSSWLLAFAEPYGAELSSSGTLHFESGSYPGVAFEDVYPDWRSYDTLVVEFSAGERAPALVALRIDDAGTARAYTDRYNGEWRVQPGANRWAVPLDNVRWAPQARDLDLRRIAVLILFSDASAAGTLIELHEIALK